MADLKISALNSLAGADLVAADVVAVVDDSASETKKLTVSDLIANGVTLISNSTIPSAKILFAAGSVATASVADAGITTAKVADDAITAAKLANNSSVTLVSTLPASGDFTGQIALDTDDDKIYIWDGSAWDSVKGAGSINVVNGSTTGEINIVTSTSGDTVTVSATLDDTSAAAQFLAGPTGAGGTVGYRAIIGTDLPTATTTAKGGVIVNGNGLTMSSDTIAIDNSVTAETSENHIVQYDANGLVTGGRAIVAADVPNATSTTVGVIKPGSGLGVTGAGELNHDNSVTAGTASKVTFDTEGHITGTESLVAADIPDLDADKITTGTVPTARIASDAITAAKLADKSTTTIAELTPSGGDFIGQGHLNSISGDFLIWDGNVWQPIGVSVGEIVLAGTYDASTNLMATVTSEGTSLSYVVGSALPAASASNKGYYVVVSEAGTGTSPAPTVALNPPDFLLSTGTAYTEIDVSSTVVAQVAENISFTAAGNISATNVQAAIEELDTEKVGAASPTFTGTVALGEDAVMTFEGATSNAFETTLTVTDPTADRTITLPNVTGTVVTTGDTGSVTSTMITDGTIVNADINASAEIAVSKLANGTARQLLQTDVAGTGVEFTSNVDVPGTLDVTGAATLDSTLGVTGLISADGKVKFPAGTASAPSFYSGTDTNTGLYFSAADEVSITTGGTQRIAVDSSGRLLVGVSSSSGAGAAIQSIGTHPLQIHRGVAATGGPHFTLSKSRNTAYGSSTIVQSGDTLGTIQFRGDDGTDYQSTGASIQAFVDGTPSADDMPGRLVFNTTADGSITPSERLRIDSSGRVLIGTTTEGNSFADNLTIADSGNSGLTIRSGSSSYGSIHFSDATSGLAEYAGFVEYNHNSNYLNFGVNSVGRMRITSSGNVGIGTASPSNLLHIHQSDTSENSYVHITHVDGGSAATDGLSIGLESNGINASIRNRENGYLRMFTNNTERMRIDSSGRLLVGTTTEGHAEADNLTIADSGKAGITIRSGSSESGYIDFSDGTSGDDEYRGVVAYNHGSNYMFFYTNASEAMRIDSSGNVGIGATSINNSYGTNVNIHTSTTNGARLKISDGTSGNGNVDGLDIIHQSGIAYIVQRENNDIRISTNNAEALRITSAGVVTAKKGAVAEIDTLTSASTVTPDFAASCNFTLTLGTNVTLANPSNVTAGQSGSIFLVQDGTGSRTLTLGSNYDFAGGTAPTLSTAANAVDRLDYIVRTSTSIHCVVTLAYS